MSRQLLSLLDEPLVAMAAAEAAIEAGGCIVIPTDTVYGIAADAANPDAVARLLAAKGRGRDMPVPVMIADPELARALADPVPAAAQQLIDKFWPGSMTVVLRMRDGILMDLGETRGTVALRVPAHEEVRQLLRRTGPLAVSSANRSGDPAAITVDDAGASLTEGVAVFLDGGPSTAGTASTIVDFAVAEEGFIRRVGAVSADDVRAVVPHVRTA